MKKVALFDVCNTIVSVSTLDDFVEHFLLSSTQNPRGGGISGFQYAALKFLQFLRRLRLIRSVWYKQYLLSRFRGYSAADLAPLAQRYVEERLSRLLKREVICQLQKFQSEGLQVYLVSGALDVYLEPLASSLGAGLISTELEKNERGIYTGRIVGEECSGFAKAAKVKKVLAAVDIDWEGSVAFGDSVFDLPMLPLVGNAFVVDPEPKLEQIACERGWQIIRSKNLQ